MFPRMRYKKMFSGDLKSSTVPRDFNSFTRIGRIVSVDPAKGICRLQWLDRPGFREGVLLTQGSDGEWNIPRVGAVVIVAFDIGDQARIIRYVNVGHKIKTDAFELPALSEGEKFWECAGASLYITANGDIILRSASLGTVTLEKGSDTFKSETTNWKVTTVGGEAFWGQVKRFKPQLDGSYASEVITDLTGDSYVEYTFNLFETAGDKNALIPGDPLIKITLGTVVDDSGNVVDEEGTTLLDNTKSLCLQFDITKDTTKVFSLKINKEGKVSLNCNALTINNGTKGVARLDDEVTSTSTEDSTFWNWVNAVHTFLTAANSAGTIGAANTSYIGKIQLPPSHQTSKITKASTTTKVGD
jgi:hypothetical protein